MRLEERMVKLREACLRCWAVEFSDFSPQGENSRLAKEELARFGNPDCQCGGIARLEFQDSED